MIELTDVFPAENEVKIPKRMARQERQRRETGLTPPSVDPDTRVLGGRFLDETLTRETARADRGGYPLTMLLIDLDHFKHVNDIYGHVVGDRVLTSIARLLRSSVREADVVLRSRDKEFVILLPFADLTDAAEVRDRILRRVRTSDLLPGRPGEVTMTIVKGQYKVCEGKECFRARVEQAMFQAKRNDDDGLSGVRVPVR